MSWAKDTPLVSVVTPSYNQGQFIEDTLRSVMNQDYPHVEHVVVDGGSTDRTIDVLNSYDAYYELRWVSEPDRGQAHAINKAFEMSRGEIVGWLNSDDCYLTRDVVRRVISFWKNHGSADVIHGNRVVIDEFNNLQRLYYSTEFSYEGFLNGNCTVFQETVFLQRHVVERHRLDESLQYAMDTEYWLRLGSQYRFAFLNNFTGAFRHHGDSKTMSDHHSAGRTREKERLKANYGKIISPPGIQKRPMQRMIHSKLKRLRSGAYNHYWRLPWDILWIGTRSNRDFAFPIQVDGARLPRALFRSLKPGLSHS